MKQQLEEQQQNTTSGAVSGIILYSLRHIVINQSNTASLYIHAQPILQGSYWFWNPGKLFSRAWKCLGI